MDRVVVTAVRSGRRRSSLALSVMSLWLAGACSSMLPSAAEQPRLCADVFAAARCEAIALATAHNVGLDPTLVTGVIILPSPAVPEGQIGRAREVRVRLTLADGGQRDTSFSCPGVSAAFLPHCMDQPHLVLRNPIDNGYRDFPEDATPVPEIERDAAAAAVELSIERIEIPIDAPGPQRVKVGEAGLPNGILTEVRFETEEAWPSDFVLRGGTVEIELVGERGDTLWNLYEHGWVEGVETIDVFIAFDAGIVRPGAKLVILGLFVG
jgi:hypothetical protein